VVDVWQCDALGVYSDVRDTNGLFDTVGQKYLRGHQVTDVQGTAKFVTIFPGWYQGRTVHVHFKIRTRAASGNAHEFTSQLYFADDVVDRVMRLQPYAGKGQRPVRNAQDGIYRRGGQQLTIAVDPVDDGYVAAFDIGLQLA
jgi:protocatechuate 3,4-dioxygenase beta subunit